MLTLDETIIDPQVNEDENIISSLEDIEKKHIYLEQLMLSIIRTLDQLLD